MRRILVVAYLLWLGNLLVVGPASTRSFVLVCAALFAAVVLTERWSHFHPDHPLARILWSSHGPGPDLTLTPRAQLLRSSWQFLAWGALLFATFVAIVAGAGPRLSDSILPMYAAGFFMLSGLVGITGGLYFLARGVFRAPR